MYPTALSLLNVSFFLTSQVNLRAAYKTVPSFFFFRNCPRVSSGLWTQLPPRVSSSHPSWHLWQFLAGKNSILSSWFPSFLGQHRSLFRLPPPFRTLRLRIPHPPPMANGGLNAGSSLFSRALRFVVMASLRSLQHWQSYRLWPLNPSIPFFPSVLFAPAACLSSVRGYLPPPFAQCASPILSSFPPSLFRHTLPPPG